VVAQMSVWSVVWHVGLVVAALFVVHKAALEVVRKAKGGWR
jgi:hypothetical protein